MHTCLKLPLALLLLGTAMLQTAAADPTRPPTPEEIRAWYGEETGQPAQTRWRLQSVLIGDTRRVAVINGQRVGVGDSINRARVEEIRPYRVVLVDENGEPLTLTMDTRRTSSGD